MGDRGHTNETGEALPGSLGWGGTTIEGSQDAALLVLDGMVRYSSARAEEIFCRDGRELIGSEIEDLLHPEDREWVVPALAGRPEDGRPRDGRPGEGKPLRFRLISRDGQKVSVVSVPMTWDGSPAHLIRPMGGARVPEEAVIESEERYRDLFENSSDLIQILSLDGSIIYVNRAWREALGYEEDEIEGLCIFDIIHPECQDHCRDFFPRVASGEKSQRAEIILLSRSGETVIVEANIECKLQGGLPDHIRCICRNITLSQRAEEELRAARDGLEQKVKERTGELLMANEALRRREMEFEALAENAPDFISRFNRDLSPVYVNPAIEAVMGIPRGVFLEWKDWEDLLASDQTVLWKPKLIEVFREGREVSFDFTLPVAGEPRSYHTRLVPERVGDGSVESVLSVTRDVTEIIETRKALEAERALLEEVLRQMPAGIVIADSSGRIVMANEQMMEIWRSAEMPSEDIESYHREYMGFHADGSPFSVDERPLARALRRGEAVKGEEMRIIRGDGSPGILLANSTPIRDESGAIMAAVSAFHDITDRMGMESELRAGRDRLEQKVRERTGELLRANEELQAEFRDRKEAEGRLRRSEALLRSMAENSPLAFLFIDSRSDSILYFNRRFCDLWGLTGLEAEMREGELKGSDLISRLVERVEDPTAFEALCGPSGGGPEGSTYEDEVRSLDGRIIRRFSTQIRDDEERYLGRLCIFEDVTDRRRSEEAVRDANERLHALIRASPLAILTLDIDGRVLSWNDAALRIFGYREDEVLGRPLPIVPDVRELESRALMEMLVRGRMFTGVEVQRQRKDGCLIDVSLSSAPIRDGEGRIGGVISVMDDITKRKSAERSLRENLHFLQRLIDTIPNPIFYKGVDGRFQGCNVAFEKFLGVTREEVIGRTVYDIYPKEQGDACSKTDADLFRDPGIQIYETTMHLKDGRKVGVMFNKATYTNTDGTLAGLVGVMIDITERNRAEAELRSAKEIAEAAVRVKSEFLANMSHEIRTPMNAVIGMTGLLLDTPLSQEQMECVETIRGSGDALLAIINDILDFSKIEGGKMELESQPFDLCDCVEVSLDLMAAKAAEKGLNLAYFVDDTTPCTLLGDVTRLRQILANLISNAVKFTDKGEVVVSVSSRRLGEGRYQFHFKVADTGIGIPPDRMNRLFQSFSQIDSSTTRKYGGTGLGLAICKRLVELMDGRIWAESEPGQGSTFHFTIFAEAAPRESGRSRQRGPHPAFEGKRVLVVDDGETNRRLLMHHVASWGMIPEAADSAAIALDRLLDEDYDLAIMEMQMPEMDGPSLAEVVRREGRAMPIIMIASLGKSDVIGEMIGDNGSGITAFLTKPIKPSHLHDALMAVLSDGAVIRPAIQPEPRPGIDYHLRILLAEDNIINQKVALRMLKKIGYRADVAANGLEVLEALQRQPYDVVLMDIQMPEMDGLEAARAIRERLEVSLQPRIIAITAYALEGDRERCIEAGMDDYVSKPVQIDELSSALKKCWPAEDARSIDT